MLRILCRVEQSPVCTNRKHADRLLGFYRTHPFLVPQWFLFVSQWLLGALSALGALGETEIFCMEEG